MGATPKGLRGATEKNDRAAPAFVNDGAPWNSSTRIH
jgi:hypothetical protein